MKHATDQFFRDADLAAAGAPSLTPEVENALTKLAIAAKQAMVVGDRRTFRRAVDGLRRAYEQVPALSEYSSEYRSPEERQAAQFWLALILRVFVLGAIAVREEKWWAVRELALVPRPLPAPFPGYISWLRHAGVMAARAGLLVSTDGKQRGGLILSLAREFGISNRVLAAGFGELPALELGEAPRAQDPLLDALCQFDLAWCLVVATVDTPEPAPFYPSCAALHEWRAEPVMTAIAETQEIRGALFEDTPDEIIGRAFLDVVGMAQSESRFFGGYWPGLDVSPAALQFVRLATGSNL